MSQLKHVLYVDDEADIRTVVQMALESVGGMRVTLCSSGTEALACLADTRPDLILLDVMMPEMDGPTVLSRLQQWPGGLPAPVVFLTAKAMPEEVDQLKSLGAVAVVAKPFDPMTLAAHLRELWSQYAPAPAPAAPASGMPPALAAELARLERQFRSELPHRFAHIRQLWQQLQAEHSPDTLADLHRSAHSLVGSAATLRVSAVATAARQLEQLLKPLLEGGAGRLPAASAAIDAGLGELESIVAQAAVVGRTVDLPAAGPEPTPIAVSAKTGAAAGPIARIAMLSTAPPTSGLTQQLEGFGYQLLVCRDRVQLHRLVDEGKPEALLLDLDALPEDCASLRTFSESGLPLLGVSSSGDFGSRLAAVRAGLAGYLCKPFDAVQLAVALDRYAQHVAEPPYRVLLIDDEPAVAGYHAEILRAAGMAVEYVESAELGHALLEDFAPDVIVTDVYMPEVGGIELARVLRQQERYDHIPIVFLSSERNLDVQQLAVGFGADDFLVKPVIPEHFISAISNRARRARALRAAMTHDGLTGLLNHKSAKTLLEQEVARMQRSGRMLTLALADVDHFKHVNDAHGHLAGDRVLAALARLLRQRLRRGDHVCRYGGEEFLLILPETNAQDGIALVDSLRRAFGQLHFSGGSGDFAVTFSAGLAVSRLGETPEQLMTAADNALYAAKSGGRNQVKLAVRRDLD